MTLSDEAKLYIIEPYNAQKNINKQRKGIRNHRRILKEQKDIGYGDLHCSELCLGDEKLQIQGGTGGSLEYSTMDYSTIQLFFDMMSAGWQIPEWLKEEEWENLELVTLNIADIKTLPKYLPEMPITITYKPNPIQHIIEKTVTLTVGKSRSFYFMDSYGDKVWCYINNIKLMDVWKNTEEQFKDSRLLEKFTPKQVQQTKKQFYSILEKSCPKGMCYLEIEYECSKDISLTFYSKEYLKSRPEPCTGSSSILLMHSKPDKETGTHNLPLKSYIMQTPLSPDTVKVPAELFLYYEIKKEWVETIL